MLTRYKRYLPRLFVALGLALNIHIILTYSRIEGSDFSQDYKAAQHLVKGEGIYKEWNDHPPLNSVVYIPLILASEEHAFIIFGLISLAATLVACKLVIDGLGSKNGLVLAACCLFWPQVNAAFALGASSLIWGMLMIAAWYFEKRQYTRSAGFAIALATSLKILPGILIAVWVIQRKWRPVLAALISIFMGMAIFIALGGIEDFICYGTSIAPHNVETFLDFYGNISINSLVEKFIGSPKGWTLSLIEMPLTAKLLSVAISIALLFDLALSALRSSPKTDADRVTALAITTMLLVSPITWGHYLLPLILPLMLLHEEGIDRHKILFIILLLLSVAVPEHYLGGPDYWRGKSAIVQLLTTLPVFALIMIWSTLFRLLHPKKREGGKFLF